MRVLQHLTVVTLALTSLIVAAEPAARSPLGGGARRRFRIGSAARSRRQPSERP